MLKPLKSPNSVYVKVVSRYGCFTRPEMNTHRVSYAMLTPTAAAGILQAVYAKTREFKWKIRRLFMLKKPSTTSFMSNEVSSKVNMRPKAGKPIYPGTGAKRERLQRRNLILQDCSFGIEASPVLIGSRANTNNEQKHISMLLRRLDRGACFYRPYMGIRDYPAEAYRVDMFEPVDITADLGWMPLTSAVGGNVPKLFHAQLVHGCVEVPNV